MIVYLLWLFVLVVAIVLLTMILSEYRLMDITDCLLLEWAHATAGDFVTLDELWQIGGMMDIVDLLKKQAEEITHKGWGNTMLAAAQEIERLRQEVVEQTDFSHGPDCFCSICIGPSKTA